MVKFVSAGSLFNDEYVAYLCNRRGEIQGNVCGRVLDVYQYPSVVYMVPDPMNADMLVIPTEVTMADGTVFTVISGELGAAVRLI